MTTARELTGSRNQITGAATSPKHAIVTAKLQRLGMQFGGRPLLEETIRQMVAVMPRS